MEKVKKLWFKRKLYGRGRTPATREGWLVVLCYIFLMLGRVAYYQDISTQDMLARQGTYKEVDAGGNGLILMLPILLLTTLLLLISYTKGESPKRQWGKRDS